MTPRIGNRGSKRATLLTVAVLTGAGLVAGIRAVPPLVERWRYVQRLAAQNEELHRQPPGEPFRRRLSEREIRERLRRPEPGHVVFELKELPGHHK